MGWVRDAAGVQRKVSLTEARNREEAKRLEQDLRMRARRQREGLDPLASDCKWTVRELLRWWLDEYRAGARQDGDRFRNHFDGSAPPLRGRVGTAGRKLVRGANGAAGFVRPRGETLRLRTGGRAWRWRRKAEGGAPSGRWPVPPRTGRYGGRGLRRAPSRARG